MTIEDIKSNLCIYNELNPDHIYCEEKFKPNPCHCDNCYHGKSQLAWELLKYKTVYDINITNYK